MGFYVASGDPLKIETACERSPVIVLKTDSAAIEAFPAAIRGAADEIVNEDVELLRGGSIPSKADAALFWMEGDQLTEGSSATFRGKAWSDNARIFCPVHLPCLPEIDLLGILPRVWTKSTETDGLASDIRVVRTTAASALAMNALEEQKETWARHYCALLAEHKTPGGGIEPLSKLWRETRTLSPVEGALLMRNLVVLQIRQNQLKEADHLLNLALDTYPRCAELSLLAAWLCIAQDKLRRAGRHVEQAMERSDPQFPGSGGERSYRAQWLLGLAAELCGKQTLAVNAYKIGVAARPAFAPSVLGLLRQRLSRADAGTLASWVLLTLVHREPQYLEPVFQFCLIHRQFDPAARLLLAAHLPDEARLRLQEQLDVSYGVYRQSKGRDEGKPGVALIGPFFVNSSLARINRELAVAASSADEFQIAFEPHGLGDLPPQNVPHSDLILRGYKSRLTRLDLTIRHHWPPDFEPPPSGKLICIFPWEYSSVPKRWVQQIQRNVDEVWVPSQFVKSALTQAGVAQDKVQVIPNGIDANIYMPEGPLWRPEGCRKFVFLFVGGAILRKGADVLWKAYSQAFNCDDDVTLVVKDTGPGTFYLGMSLLEEMKTAAAQPRAPHLITLTEDFDDVRLAALYRGCNAFVLPYRGEGFGMTLAEAIACGRPALTTSLGPAKEFCPAESTVFIPARLQPYFNPQNQFGPMSGPEAWFEPDATALAAAMRRLAQDPEGAARAGAAGASVVRFALSWERINTMQMGRIRRLAGIAPSVAPARPH